MRYTKLSFMFLCALSLATLLFGCGSSSNKEGAALGSPNTVASVGDIKCIQCHSAVVDPLTGEGIVQQYELTSPHKDSPHANKGNGCEACHGGGAQHNGVGPIPYPNPFAGNGKRCTACHNGAFATNAPTKFADSKHATGPIEDGEPCRRCHTHEGAVLGMTYGLTGDGVTMENPAYQGAVPFYTKEFTSISCGTCHEHGAGLRAVKTRDAAGNVVTWNPSATVGSVDEGSEQYRFCTQCHGYITPTGELMGSGTTSSGTVTVGHHETSWYRIIGSTHYDDPTTDDIEGYNVRTTNANACYDCHGHEANTNSNNDPASTSFDAAEVTIYTEWAQSGHAGNILTAKYAAAAANPVDTTLGRTDPVRVAQGLAQVDSVMTATVPAGAFGGHNTPGVCQRCHTTEGFATYTETLTKSTSTVPAGVLKCYGCHSNPGVGTLRTLKGAKEKTNYTTDLGWDPTANFLANATAYTLNYGKKAYPDVAASNLCIECHDSREKDPGAITDASTNYQRTHYLQAAATMYVKMGFISFGTGTEAISSVPIDTTLLSSQDGGSITSTHRILGTPAIIGDHGITAAQTNLTSNGPCVTCHFNGGDHSLTIDQKIITAVCNNCHSSEGGQDITTIANFRQYFLDPQSEAYEDVLLLAITTFNDLSTGITITAEPDLPEFVRAYTTVSVATPTFVEAKAADWTAAATALGAGYNKQKVMGAVSNIVFLKREPAAYAHARTYSRRLLYDTIDYLDNGVMDKTVGATALTKSGTVGSPVFGLFGKDHLKAFEDSTLTNLQAPTTEAMVFLIKWSRSTGLWDTTSERP